MCDTLTTPPVDLALAIGWRTETFTETEVPAMVTDAD